MEMDGIEIEYCEDCGEALDECWCAQQEELCTTCGSILNAFGECDLCNETQMEIDRHESGY